ncbi:MAG: sigma-70 family RNA polymerase sigma factor [Acidobacteriota bacterium]
MNPQEVFLANIDMIERVIAFVCRTNRLNTTASEDFASEVKLALIANDYDILRKFEGRSSLSTFLTTVIQRLFYQQRVKEWGKWRPSAEARRMGEKAVTLERLLTRDGFSFSEARQFLTAGTCPGYDIAELEAMHVRLPPRRPRPVLVEQDEVAEAVADDRGADAGLYEEERARTARLAVAALEAAMTELTPEDQMILRLRFWQARKAPEIATALHIDQKKVYKRLDRLMATLRRALERSGIGKGDIDGLLTGADQELQLTAIQEGKTSVRPSDSTDGIGGGESRRSG